jgi:hypothetical protein
VARVLQRVQPVPHRRRAAPLPDGGPERIEHVGLFVLHNGPVGLPLVVHHVARVAAEVALRGASLRLRQELDVAVHHDHRRRFVGHELLGRRVVLPHGEHHEREHHGVDEPDGVEDEAGDRLLALPALDVREPPREPEPHERGGHREGDHERAGHEEPHPAGS